MLSPDVLLPIAERGGLMRALDRWVLRTALTEATRWPHSQGHPVSVAVNLAGLLPDGAEAVHEITTILAETGIDPTRAVLEITETNPGRCAGTHPGGHARTRRARRAVRH